MITLHLTLCYSFMVQIRTRLRRRGIRGKLAIMPDETMPGTARPKLSARARLQTDRITGKPVLLYPEGALLLNRTGHSIALLCNGTTTLDGIISSLAQTHEKSASDIASQVGEFLNRLRAKNLIELS